MSRLIDMTGKKVGKWTVLRYLGDSYWLCRCECGNEKPVVAYSLRSGKSNGCNKCFRIKHGGSRSPEYHIWIDMKQRCLNPNEPNYKHYGARGVKVCQRWQNKFENFLEDMGRRPGPKMQIDRIDVNGDYCPENCRWVTSKENTRNQTNNRFFTINGERKCLAEWCEIYNKTYCCVEARLSRGWDIVRALSTPINENIWKNRRRLTIFGVKEEDVIKK